MNITYEDYKLACLSATTKYYDTRFEYEGTTSFFFYGFLYRETQFSVYSRQTCPEQSHDIACLYDDEGMFVTCLWSTDKLKRERRHLEDRLRKGPKTLLRTLNLIHMDENGQIAKD
jgi:hypothetical protein